MAIIQFTVQIIYYIQNIHYLYSLSFHFIFFSKAKVQPITHYNYIYLERRLHNTFNIKKNKQVKFNTLIALPNYNNSWLEESNIYKALFLYTYLRINQIHIDGSYKFNTYNFLSLIYTQGNIKSNHKKLIDNINITFGELKKYKLISVDVIVKDKLEIISLAYSAVANEFETKCYTLIDYSVINKIFTTDADVEKDRLLYCCFFLNNRARNATGYTSYEDIGQILGGKSTIAKYLEWFRQNEIFDYYSTNHKLDENGVPKRGNTIVAKWENRKLIDEIRKSDIPCKSSTKDVNILNERFKDDKFYCKLSKVLKYYGLINNFLLLRLWNELPYGFTWEAIYKYLNRNQNIEFFTHNSDFEVDDNDEEKQILIPITDKTKIISKIVNMAKKQENDVLSYIAELYNEIIENKTEDILIGRIYEKTKSKKTESNSDWGEADPTENDDFEQNCIDISKKGKGLIKHTIKNEVIDYNALAETQRLNEEQMPNDILQEYNKPAEIRIEESEQKVKNDRDKLMKYADMYKLLNAEQKSLFDNMLDADRLEYLAVRDLKETIQIIEKLYTRWGIINKTKPKDADNILYMQKLFGNADRSSDKIRKASGEDYCGEKPYKDFNKDFGY